MQKVFDEYSIVVIGSFNPAILHPGWFSRHTVVPAEESQGLESEPSRKTLPEIGVTIEYGKKFSVSNESANIAFSSFQLQVKRDKFQVVFESLDKKDLVIESLRKIFSILGETPIKAYGINVSKLVPSEESELPDLFLQNEKLEKLFGEGYKYGYKLFSVRDDARVLLDIEPKTKDGKLYTSISTNFHYEKDDMDCKYFVSNISGGFKKVVTYFSDIHSKVIIEG